MSIDVDIRNVRRDYKFSILNEDNLKNNPFDLFKIWFEEALKFELKEVNAMTLSTVKDNRASSRVVLLKQIVNDKFIFFTNYNSNKGKEIETNPNVALNFFWEELQRQVRVEGIAKKSHKKISDEYFAMRGKDSQISAWVSNQSEPMTGKELKDNLLYYTEKFKDVEVPRPIHWGAYEIEAVTIEFWQGGANRLHHRFLYEKIDEFWKVKRLGP